MSDAVRAPVVSAGRRLRIVLAETWYYPDHPSGPSRLCYDEARYLAGLGHEVWLVAQHAQPGLPEHVLADGVNVLRYRRPPWAAFDPRARGVHQRRALQLLERYVGPQVDFVHCHTLLAGAAALDYYRTRAPVCYTLHSPVRSEYRATARAASTSERLRLRLAGAVRHRLERRCLGEADVVTVDSRYAQELVAGAHGLAIAARATVQFPWVDVSRFSILDNACEAKRSLGWPTDVPVLFCLRRLVPRMGLDRLLNAAALVMRSGRSFRLVVGGDGPLRRQLEDRVLSSGLAASVSLPGRIPDANLHTMYAAADAFVLPTTELECFGLVALEAMASGRPVLGTPVGAIPEVIGSIEPQWVARDESTEGLAALLVEFLDGRLPFRAPSRLRTQVEAQYLPERRIPEIVALALARREAA